MPKRRKRAPCRTNSCGNGLTSRSWPECWDGSEPSIWDPFFTSRSAEIRNGIEEAQKVKVEAEARAADIEKRIGNLVAEVERMRGQSREEISAEGARISAETAQQISRLQAQAENEIASSAKAATIELKVHAAALALKMAEQQIRGRMTPQTQEALVDSFVGDLRTQEPKTKAISN